MDVHWEIIRKTKIIKCVVKCRILKSDVEILKNTPSAQCVFQNSLRSSGSRVHWQRRRCRRQRAEWGTALCRGRHHHLGPGTEHLSRSLREGNTAELESVTVKKYKPNTYIHQHTWELRYTFFYIYFTYENICVYHGIIKEKSQVYRYWSWVWTCHIM